MSPDVLLLIANLTVARKPGRGPTVHPDPLRAADDASLALGEAVEPFDLAGLRELHRLVVDLVDRLLHRRELDSQTAALTALARPSRATVVLEGADGRLRQKLEWSESDVVSRLARQLILELVQIDPARLRRCGRSECDLLFYDRTRSNTQRWHAESPCGQRERQRRHRSARHSQSGEQGK